VSRCVSLFLAVIFVLFSLTSCFDSDESEYFVKTRRDSTGRLSISVSRAGKDGSRLSEKELYAIYDGACSSFDTSYSELSPDDASELSLFNAEFETIFDIDPAVTEEVLYAFRLSELTDGLYEPCGGTLTSLLEADAAPDEKALHEALSHVGTDRFSIADGCLKKSDPLARLDLGAVRDACALRDTVEYLKSTECAYSTVSFNGIAGVFGEKADGSPFCISLGSGSGGSFNIKEGYVALVSENFGTATDFKDGKLDSPIRCATVFSPDARIAASLAGVAYVNGAQCLLSIYEKGELPFEAVLTQKNGSSVYTPSATKDQLYVPETAAEESEK